MNATQTTVTHLLDADWLVVIADTIASQPETLSDVVEPELMGRFDAEMGLPCEPLRYYAKLGHIEAYIIGWRDTQALLADTEEYEDDMLDRTYWARGSW